MNLANVQVEILSRIAGMMIESVSCQYTSMSCRFVIDCQDESVEQEFWFANHDNRVSTLINDPDWIISDLIFELHNVMRSHTGGSWTSFTLEIDSEGKVKTRFEYPK
ncbi:hypothetical protein [Photobacterium sp. R1]